MDKSARDHRDAAEGDARSQSARCAVLTVSDTRTLETDGSGALIIDVLEKAGHAVTARGIVRDEPADIGAWLDAQLAAGKAQVILTTGGTGVAKRDSTIDVVRTRIESELEGFGELFRMLSYEEVGAAAMLSRATAGTARRSDGSRVLIFAMPGSRNAVETAMHKLIAPELSHLVWETVRV